MVWRRERLFNSDDLVEQLVALRQELVRIGSQQSQALTTGIRSSVAADARRQLATHFPTHSKRLFDYSRDASPLLPDFSKSIVGRAFVGQSPGLNVFGVRGKVAGLALSRAVGVAGLSTFRSSTSSILGTALLGKRPWWPDVAKPPGWRVARTAGLGQAFAAVAGQRLGFSQYAYRIQGSAAARALFPRVVLPSFKLPDFGGQLRDSLGKWTELFDEVAAFVRRWQQRALWYLLSGLPLGVTRQLGGLTEAEVEAAVVDALEAVMTDGEFVPALREAVADAPHLVDSQRTHLDHMLEHAAQREYVHAVAPLYFGLEGAFWQVAYQLPVVTPERRDLRNPNKLVGFETVVKLLPLEQELQTFMVREVFGTVGNPYRHGDASSGERRQVLFGIAALAGWLEQFAKVPALDVLGSRVSEALPAAIERVRAPVLALNAGT